MRLATSKCDKLIVVELINLEVFRTDRKKSGRTESSIFGVFHLLVDTFLDFKPYYLIYRITDTEPFSF